MSQKWTQMLDQWLPLAERARQHVLPGDQLPWYDMRGWNSWKCLQQLAPASTRGDTAWYLSPLCQPAPEAPSLGELIDQAFCGLKPRFPEYFR